MLELDTLTFIEPSEELIVQHLRTNERERIGFERADLGAKRLEDYLVFALIDLPDIDYFTQSDLLYDLSSQVVQHFREVQGRTDRDIKGIFIVNQRPIARFIYEQMRTHRFEEATEYETVVSQGFIDLKPSAYTARETDKVYKLEEPPPSKSDIKRYVYGHFKRCLYSVTKFDSDPERILAGILEREAEKWFRPARGQFQIHHRLNGDPKEYQPDFVAELTDQLVMLEVKNAEEGDDAEVLEKARIAHEWCNHASRHALEHGAKPWAYFLILHNEIQSNMTLSVLLRQK